MFFPRPFLSKDTTFLALNPCQRRFCGSNDETLNPFGFRGRQQLGEIQYCFPVSSSGDSALDEQALLYVDALPFPQKTRDPEKADSFLAWGMQQLNGQ